MVAEPKRCYRPWTARERELVLRHYGPHAALPWPTYRIALAVGRSRADVCAAAARWGRSYRRIAHPRHHRLLALYREGLDDGWIALVVGCCREHVQRWRKRHGLPALKWGWGWPRKA